MSKPIPPIQYALLPIAKRTSPPPVAVIGVEIPLYE
jgi:hypothetical protein